MSVPLADRAPTVDQLTDYDRAQLVTYLRLLDADAEGAPWEEAVRVIFAVDPATDPPRWQAVHASHLARARWMSASGYRHLLRDQR